MSKSKTKNVIPSGKRLLAPRMEGRPAPFSGPFLSKTPTSVTNNFAQVSLKDIRFLLKYLSPTHPVLENRNGTHVSSIAIKTGTVQSADSHCAAMLEICDSSGKCCNTSSNLNNPGLDRRSGKIDKYTEQSLLGSCAQKVSNIYKMNIKDKSSINFFSQGKLGR